MATQREMDFRTPARTPENSVRAARAVAASLPHDCWWDGDVTGNMQGTETCTRCRLEAALGGAS